MVGEWKDYIIHPDGRAELVDEGRNLVVNSAYIVMAMCMKQDPSFGGFLWWAVGDGNTDDTASWDAGVVSGAIQPSKADTRLAREIFRKKIEPEDIQFIDSAGNPSVNPTNRLQITVEFLEDEPDGTAVRDFREWGIFGGNATSTKDSGYLINRKVHKTYQKSPLSRLRRVLLFTF